MIIGNNSHIPKEIALQGIFPHLDVKSIFSLPRVSKSYKEAFEELMKGILSRRVECFPFKLVERELNPAIEFTRFVARLNHLSGLKAIIRKREEQAVEGKIEGSILNRARGLTNQGYSRLENRSIDEGIANELKEAYIKASRIRNFAIAIPDFFLGMQLANLVMAFIICAESIVSTFNSPSSLECGVSFLAGLSYATIYCYHLVEKLNINTAVRIIRDLLGPITLLILFETGMVEHFAGLIPGVFGLNGILEGIAGHLLFASIWYTAGYLCGLVIKNIGGLSYATIHPDRLVEKLNNNRPNQAMSVCGGLLGTLTTLLFFKTGMGIEPFARPILGVFGLEGIAGDLLFTSICMYTAGYLWGPAAWNVGLRMIAGVRNGVLLSAVADGVVKGGKELASRICMNIQKKIWEHRDAVAVLAVFGAFCYHNTTANEMVVRLFSALLGEVSIGF